MLSSFISNPKSWNLHLVTFFNIFMTLKESLPPTCISHWNKTVHFRLTSHLIWLQLQFCLQMWVQIQQRGFRSLLLPRCKPTGDTLTLIHTSWSDSRDKTTTAFAPVVRLSDCLSVSLSVCLAHCLLLICLPSQLWNLRAAASRDARSQRAEGGDR